MTTWNPGDKSASITLTSGDLVATGSGSTGGVRSTTSYSAGKLYWEVTLSGTAPGANCRQGIATSGFTLTANLGSAGGGTSGCGFNPSTGAVTTNGTNIGTAEGYTTADVLSFALDLTNSKIWMRKNGGNWNNSALADPATNTGGFSVSGMAAGPYFMIFANASPTNAAAVTMSPSSFTYSVPSGFTAWDVVGGGTPVHRLTVLGVG